MVIRNNPDGTLDELIGFCHLHVEQMDNDHWWIGIDTADGKMLHLRLSTRNGAHIRALLEEDGESDMWAKEIGVEPR